MKRRSPTRKLQIESLEDRRLTATLTSAIGAVPIAPKSEIALVQSIGPIEQVALTRGLVDASSWKMGIRLNHNETLVRARRRSN